MISQSFWHGLARFDESIQQSLSSAAQPALSSCSASPEAISFSRQWSILGPFQIGTREAVWGADPVELYGGFHSLEYDGSAVFRSSLASGGVVAWSNLTSSISENGPSAAHVTLDVDFAHIPWQPLRETHGWAAHQWQAWMRGEVCVHSDEPLTLALYTPQILEFWLDDQHYFGGDFYSYERAPLVVKLDSGTHRLDVRLIRDVRSMGGTGSPTMAVSLSLHATRQDLTIASTTSHHPDVLISDLLVDGPRVSLASPYGSLTLRNDADVSIHVVNLRSTHDSCRAALLSDSPISFISGQTRPIAFGIECDRTLVLPPLEGNVLLELAYTMAVGEGLRTLTFLISPKRHSMHEPHKITFIHDGAVVSYAILRPPSQKAIQSVGQNSTMPVMLQLHGAGLEAENQIVRHALDLVPDLHAWTLFPTGGTPWSGDDWHSWGLADVMSAILSIRDWIEYSGWDGPGVDTERWLVSGHSNGGQGTWYITTHRPDNVIAAAPVSGYSSIQNYVPYVFWQPADPGRTAVVQSALNDYKHELLAINAEFVPVLVQHGSDDDNVPPYHSRLMGQVTHEAGLSSVYSEVAGKSHWWDGVMTTGPLRAFYHEHLDSRSLDQSSRYADFSLVAANPGSTGPKKGVKIMQLRTPGQLGRIDFTIDPLTGSCTIKTSNVRMWMMPPLFRQCFGVTVDGLEWSALNGSTLVLEQNTWRIAGDVEINIPFVPQRYDRQLGTMDAILRTRGAFSIIHHSPTATKYALQISRNLCQYFAADTDVSSDYRNALMRDGNIISIAIGNDLPPGTFADHAIQIESGELVIRDHDGQIRRFRPRRGTGTAAIFVRPLRLDNLELVVWASDEESLGLASRLVPMMTGTGQPDFIVADRSLLAQGLEGTLALGFLDVLWNVSQNSFFA